jgi:hypothetical protein
MSEHQNNAVVITEQRAAERIARMFKKWTPRPAAEDARIQRALKAYIRRETT